MKQRAIQPSYYSRFSCLGSACHYTCCQEWRISLSKGEYSHIKDAIHSREMKRLFCEAFKRNKKEPSHSARYASANFDDSGVCRFLNDQKLCGLQLQCGPEALPLTCREFPRLEASILDTVERQFSLGCEAVTRLLLEERDGITFEETTLSANGFRLNTYFISEQLTKQRPVYRYAWDIKTLAGAVLQERSISLDDRMLLLGLCLKRISQMEEEKAESKIPSYVDGIIKSSPETLLSSDYLPTALNPVVSVSSALYFIKNLCSNSQNKKLDALMPDIYETLGVSETISLTELEIDQEDFKKGTLQYQFDLDHSQYESSLGRFHGWLEAYDYFLENIIVSLFFSLQLPFNNAEFNIWEHYIYFANFYNLIKIILMGTLKDGAGRDEIIYALTVIARAVPHSSSAMKFMIERAKESKTDTLAHMAILIKA